MIEPIEEFVARFEGSTAHTAVAIFRRREVEDMWGELDSPLTLKERVELADELTGWRRYDQGPGRWYGLTPAVVVSPTEVRVEQERGIDV